MADRRILQRAIGTPSRSQDVRQAILDRVERQSQPGRRDDGKIIGLCIEGGSMRGVMSAGMVLAIEQLGLLSAFDRIYGASAGALNGAYLLAGQATYGTTIYYSDINNRRFADPLRFLRGRSIVDLDFLRRDVICGSKALDTHAVLSSPITLHIAATSASNGHFVLLQSFSDDAELLDALLASSTMPILAGPPRLFRGEPYFDALVNDPVPVKAAEADGCTDILVLLTRPASDPPIDPGVFERTFILPRLSKYPEVADRYVRRHNAYRAMVASANQGTGPEGRANVFAVWPGDVVPHRLDYSHSRIVNGAIAGATAILRLFSTRDLEPLEVLQCFERARING